MINRLKKLRKKAGYSQSELAYMCGVTRNTISSLETGQYLPGCMLLMKLEYIFDRWVIQLDAHELAEIQQRINAVYGWHYPDECN